MAKKVQQKNTEGGFAVIQTGGKQYAVAPGDVIAVEKLEGDYKKGDKIVFPDVLLVDTGDDTVVGTPFIKDAKVTAVFENSGRAKKVTVIRYKQKSRYFKKNGHRQPFTKVRIEAIK
jgi:large subunit ribosomal protein L21